MIKAIVIASLITIIISSCKKNDSIDSNAVDLSKLPGKWKFISESRTGDDNSSRRSQYESETLTYKDGIAYSNIQGQLGSFYNYNLNSTNNSLSFLFTGLGGCTNNCQHWNGAFWSDFVNNGGLIKEAKIHRLDNSFLIIGNTFTVYDTTMHKNLTVTILDSLSR